MDKLIPSSQTQFFSGHIFLHFSISLSPNTLCLEGAEGDYSGLVSVVNDQAPNYSFDYKGPGQK